MWFLWTLYILVCIGTIVRMSAVLLDDAQTPRAQVRAVVSTVVVVGVLGVAGNLATPYLRSLPETQVAPASTTPSSGATFLATTPLKLRATPSLDGQVVGLIQRDGTVIAHRDNGHTPDWLHVESAAGRPSGYVSRQHLRPLAQTTGPSGVPASH